mgnify:CR=1 FL=1
MILPHNNDLPVYYLASCFNNTSATYKYYWFLSIIQSVESGNIRINKNELFARMIANAWHTVNYFHVSFGKQDKLQSAIELIKAQEGLTIDENQSVIIKSLLETNNKSSLNQLKYFNNQVPHWFLSPWFPKIQNESYAAREKRIYHNSKSFHQKCLYALHNEAIEINPLWEGYLTANAKVLKDFCYWNLALFLQAKNPNVPDIPNKLIKPAIRNSLAKQRIQFWDLVISELGFVNCIYTGEKLTIGNYAVEHFIPYNFVSHDLVWNLIPADKSFNSSKSDKLPQLEKYFDSFYTLQKTAIRIVSDKSPKNKFLEDYLTIFPDLQNLSRERYIERIQPLITIASNNGFEFLS